MIVTEIHKGDLSDVKEIGENFTASVNYPGGFVYEAFAEAWTLALDYGFGKIFCVRDAGGKVIGLLGAHFASDPFNGRKTAAEQFWFVLPEARGTSAALRLLAAFEDEAVKRQSKRIVMVRLEGEFAEILDRLYKARGYVCIERTYAKEI